MDQFIEYQLCISHYKYLLTCELCKHYSLDKSTVIQDFLPDYKKKKIKIKKKIIISNNKKKVVIKKRVIVRNKPTLVIKRKIVF